MNVSLKRGDIVRAECVDMAALIIHGIVDPMPGDTNITIVRVMTPFPRLRAYICSVHGLKIIPLNEETNPDVLQLKESWFKNT